jgi:hypothetical protein
LASFASEHTCMWLPYAMWQNATQRWASGGGCALFNLLQLLYCSDMIL